MEDGAVFRCANNRGMKDARYNPGSPVPSPMGSEAFNELACLPKISKRVGCDRDREYDERGQTTGSCKLTVDRDRGRSFHQTLINAEGPKGRNAANAPAAGWQT